MITKEVFRIETASGAHKHKGNQSSYLWSEIPADQSYQWPFAQPKDEEPVSVRSSNTVEKKEKPLPEPVLPKELPPKEKIILFKYEDPYKESYMEQFLPPE